MKLNTSFLLKTNPAVMSQIAEIAELTNMTKSAFIRQSIERNLRYFSAVEHTRYMSIANAQRDQREPLMFYQNNF